MGRLAGSWEAQLGRWLACTRVLNNGHRVGHPHKCCTGTFYIHVHVQVQFMSCRATTHLHRSAGTQCEYTSTCSRVHGSVHPLMTLKCA